MRKENYNNLINKYQLDESDIDWGKIKANLRQFYRNYEQDDPNEITLKYEQYISNEIKLFHHNNLENNNNDNTNELYNTIYDIGIFMIGFSDSPILMSLDVIRPEKIIFIYTEDSKTTIENMQEHIKRCNNSNMDYLKGVFANYIEEKELSEVKDFIVSGEKAIKINLGKAPSPLDTFKAIKDIISNRSLKKIAVDITGGKKTMVSGAFSSASLREDVDIVYVDNEEYNGEWRRPEPGTEFISKVQNPNNIYRYTDLERIKGLFNSHRYDVASEDIEKQLKVMRKYSKEYYDGDEIDKLEKLKNWADIYNDWDQYRYSDVSKHIKVIASVHDLGERHELVLNELGRIFKLMENNNPSVVLQEIFEGICENKCNIDNIDNIFKFIAVDRYCNAVRRKGTDNEGCIIRLCSIIELLSYYYLIKNLDDLCIRKKGLTISGKEPVRAIYGDYASPSKCYGQLLRVRVNIMKCLSDDCEGRYKYYFKWKNGKSEKEMIFNDECSVDLTGEIIDKRNESSIIHSIGVIESNNTDAYVETIRNFIERIFGMNKKEFDDLEDKIRFRREDEITGF